MLPFANILKELRQEKGLSQKELGKIIGVAQGAIYFWEVNRSEPTASNLLELAKFFNVSIEYLLGLETEWGTPVSSDSPQLSPNEQKIIALYRSMDKELQENAITTMELFARNSRNVKKDI